MALILHSSPSTAPPLRAQHDDQRQDRDGGDQQRDGGAGQPAAGVGGVRWGARQVVMGGRGTGNGRGCRWAEMDA